MSCVTKYAAIFIFTTVGVLCAQGPPKQGVAKANGSGGAEESTASNQDKHPAPNVTVIVNQEKTPNAQPSENKNNEDIEVQRQLAKFTKYLVIVGFLQFGVLGLTALVMRRQTRIMEEHSRRFNELATAAKDNAAAAKAGAEAATKNIDMFINKEKASIRMEFKDFSLKQPLGASFLTVDATVTNDGPTRAIIVESKIAARYLPKAVIDASEKPILFQMHGIASTVLPNTPVETFAFIFFDVDERAGLIDEIKSGNFVVEVQGFIKYRDIFKANETHITSFQRVWRPLMTDVELGSWTPSGKPEDNEQT